MAHMSIDISDTYIDARWQPATDKAVIRIGRGFIHLTVDEAETIVAGLTAAIAESKGDAAAVQS